MKKILKVIAVILCLTFFLNSVSAVAISPNNYKKSDALTVDTVHGIVSGETIPIHAFSDGAQLDYISLTSSNPSVISCSPGGYITGVKAGESADITCTAQDGSEKTFTVYCVRAVYPQEECTTNSFRTPIYAQPKNGKLLSIHLNLGIFFNALKWLFQVLAFYWSFWGLPPLNSTNALQAITSGNFKVCGQYGNYAYIRFDNNPSSDGFINYTKLSKKFDEFLYISDSELTLKSGEETAYLTADYSGEVNWEVENDDIDGTLDYDNSIIKFDPETGKITAKKGGITSIRATANGMGKTCEILSVYMWPQEWKVTANQGITLYNKPDVINPDDEIYEGDTFGVVGDLGGSNSWCYVNHGSQSFPEYSYAKIEDFSTKNTISYYNDLNIGYPIKDTSIKYISSPYSKRSSDLHRGFDITGGGSYIYGKELVSPVNGTVAYINIYCYNSNKDPSYGYCITIISDGGETPNTALKDNITGNHFAITFMHMSEAPVLREGDTVEVGDVVGKIGNTGNVSGSPGLNPPGTHLHYEINNMEALIGNSLRTDFTYNINPIYFYMDKDFEFNTGSSAYQTYGAFWYGPN